MLDFVLCHGGFLNANHKYTQQNKSVRGFGSYGDMLIRDRKMYVVPTPFRIADGLAHQYTLILPTHAPVNEEFFMVGELTRIEAPDLVVGYTFDLQMNEIRAQKVPNPTSGTKHLFRAWRLKGSSNKPVTMRDIQQISIDFAGDDEGTHE